MLSLYLNFSLFALVAAITPGPSNVLALISGSRVGIYRTLPFAIGSAGGAAFILLLTATGIAKLLVAYPVMQMLMALAGTLWLSWLAKQLFFAPAIDNDSLHSNDAVPGWKQGIGLQFINPKTWMMAITVSSLFATQAPDVNTHNLQLALIFFIIASPSICFWAVMGQATNRLINNASRQLLVNRSLSALLFISIWWAFISSQVQ